MQYLYLDNIDKALDIISVDQLKTEPEFKFTTYYTFDIKTQRAETKKGKDKVLAIIDKYVRDLDEEKQVNLNICLNHKVLTLFDKYNQRYIFRYPYVFYYCEIQKVIYARSVLYPRRVWKLMVRDSFQNFVDMYGEQK